MEPTPTYEQILKHFRGKAGLARALGISKQAVSDWGESVPEGRAYQIEVISRGRFRASQLLEEQARSSGSSSAA